MTNGREGYEPQKRKLPPPFEPQPEQVYKIEPTGGMRDDGTRWDSPRVISGERKSKKTGKIIPYDVVNCFISEMNPTADGWTEGRLAERGWFLSYRIVEDVTKRVEQEFYPFYYRMKPVIGEGGRATKAEQIYDDVTEITDVQEKIFKVEPKPEPEPEVQFVEPTINLGVLEDLTKKANKLMDKVVKALDDIKGGTYENLAILQKILTVLKKKKK